MSEGHAVDSNEQLVAMSTTKYLNKRGKNQRTWSRTCTDNVHHAFHVIGTFNPIKKREELIDDSVRNASVI